MYKSRISTRFNAFLWSQIDTLKYTEKMYYWFYKLEAVCLATEKDIG